MRELTCVEPVAPSRAVASDMLASRLDSLLSRTRSRRQARSCCRWGARQRARSCRESPPILISGGVAKGSSVLLLPRASSHSRGVGVDRPRASLATGLRSDGLRGERGNMESWAERRNGALMGLRSSPHHTQRTIPIPSQRDSRCMRGMWV